MYPWKQSLEEEIASGWTSLHMTNDLLGAIAEYGVVFMGIDNLPTLTNFIKTKAINAPGYQQYCRHQRNIDRRCQDWAKSALKHRTSIGSVNNGMNEKNIQTRQDTLDRAKAAINSLLSEGKRITVNAIRVLAGFGKGTIEKIRMELSTLINGITADPATPPTPTSYIGGGNFSEITFQEDEQKYPSEVNNISQVEESQPVSELVEEPKQIHTPIHKGGLPDKETPERQELDIIEGAIIELSVNKLLVTSEAVAELVGLATDLVKNKYQKRIDYLVSKYQYLDYLVAAAKRVSVPYQHLFVT